jgi:hypothetical protein
VAERIEFAGGSFLASVPAGGGVCVLCHVLHDRDDGAAVRILGACRRAAAAGARSSPGSSRCPVARASCRPGRGPGPARPRTPSAGSGSRTAARS